MQGKHTKSVIFKRIYNNYLIFKRYLIIFELYYSNQKLIYDTSKTLVCLENENIKKLHTNNVRMIFKTILSSNKPKIIAEIEIKFDFL